MSSRSKAIRALVSVLVSWGLVFSPVAPVMAFAVDDVASEQVDLVGDEASPEEPPADQPEGQEPAEDDGEDPDATPDAGESESEAEESDDELDEADSEEDPDAALEEQESKNLSVSYAAHVQNVGWQDAVKDGEVAGTSGKSLRMEALTFQLVGPDGEPVEGIRYKAHVQNVGWQGWVSDGELAGTTGRSYRVEALKLELVGDVAEQYDLYYRVHIQNHGWLAWASNGAAAGSSGNSLRIEAIQVLLVKKDGEAPSLADSARSYAYLDGSDVSVTAHVQNVGWQSAVKGGQTAGTTGRGLRIEAFKVSLSGYDVDGGISYQAHVQNVGWQDARSNGEIAGTTGRSLRVEAVRLNLTGEMAELYDVYYRVHAQSFGWLGWAKNGEEAGTTGMALRLEALQVQVVRKGENGPSDGGVSHIDPVSVTYVVDVAGNGWTSVAADGATSGNAGGKRGIEQLAASLVIPDDSPLSGSITYEARVTGGDWASMGADGSVVGEDLTASGETPSADRGIEAVRISLTGAVATYFDIQYRVYVDNFGWLSWTKNGSSAGTGDYGTPIRGIQICVKPAGSSIKDSSAPYVDKGNSYVGQLLRDANAAQRKVVTSTGKVPSPGYGLCAAWVTYVGMNAGIGTYAGDANDMYYAYCTSSDRQQLKVGMIVAVARHNKTFAGSIYGHVAIYIGDGWVIDNVGYIRKMRLNEWVAYYGEVVPVKWGWLGNKVLA